MSRAELTEKAKTKIERETNDHNTLVITKILLGGQKNLDAAVAAGVQPGRLGVDDHEKLFTYIVDFAGKHGGPPTMQTVKDKFPLFMPGDSNEPMSAVLDDWTKNFVRWSTDAFMRDRYLAAIKRGASAEEIAQILRDRSDELGSLGQNGHGRLRVTSSEDVKPDVPKWTWEHNGIGWIPANGLTVLVGDPGEGKGFWGCWVASHATRGSRGFPQMRVGILGHEDELGIQRARLDAAGSAPVVFLDTEDDSFMTFPKDVGLLRAAIEQYELELVIVDPINNHLDGNIRTADDKEMRSALSPLNKLGQDLGVTLIAVTHMSKGTVGAKLLYRAGGSIAISGAARQMLFLGARSDTDAEDFDEDERFLFVGKVNHSRKPLSPLKFRFEEQLIDVGEDELKVMPAMQFVGSDESGVSIQDVFSPPRGPGRPKDEVLREWIEEQIDGKTEIVSSHLEDAAHAAGRHGSWRTIRNLLKEEYGWTSHKVGTRWVWRGRSSPFLKALPGGKEDVDE